MARQSSRHRGNPDEEQPIRLCRDDRRKLWAILDAKLPSRMQRVEILSAVTTLSVLSPKFGGPTPSHVVGLIGGLFT